MIIDNGQQVRLVIDGVFEGLAGLSRGRVAFLPNRAEKKAEEAVGGTLDDKPVRLMIERDGKGPLYSAMVRGVSAPSVADMRAQLGFGSDVSDAAVVDAYFASLGFAVSVEPATQALDPWAAAAAVMFRAAGSAAASYLAPSQDEVGVRVIKASTPVDIAVGSRIIDAGSTLIHILRSDLGDIVPVKGGTIVIGQDVWKIMAVPRLDLEGVSWTCEAVEA